MEEELSPDDIVISGIGGNFPKAANVEEFKSVLFNGVDVREARWEAGVYNTFQIYAHRCLNKIKNEFKQEKVTTQI